MLSNSQQLCHGALGKLVFLMCLAYKWQTLAILCLGVQAVQQNINATKQCKSSVETHPLKILPKFLI
jgi:hypothetical protein